jgi:hypothetical protein
MIWFTMFSVLKRIVSNGKIITIIGKDLGGSSRVLIETLSQHLSGGTKESHENLSQDTRCLDRYSNT